MSIARHVKTIMSTGLPISPIQLTDIDHLNPIPIISITFRGFKLEEIENPSEHDKLLYASIDKIIG